MPAMLDAPQTTPAAGDDADDSRPGLSTSIAVQIRTAVAAAHGAYQDLVELTAAAEVDGRKPRGLQAAIDAAPQTLAAAGKSADDFLADVDRLRRRKLAVIEIAAADSDLAKVEAGIEARLNRRNVWPPLPVEGAEQMLALERNPILRRKQEAILELQRTADPALAAAIRKLTAKRMALETTRHELQGQRERATSTMNWAKEDRNREPDWAKQRMIEACENEIARIDKQLAGLTAQQDQMAAEIADLERRQLAV